MQNETLFLEAIRRFLSIYRYMRRYSRLIQAEGLSGREVSILRHILDTGTLTVGQCRDYLFISDSSTSELIGHLEQTGFVSRTRGQTDNRQVVVALTTEGRKAARAITPGGIPLLREKLKALPHEKLQRINTVLGELVELLEVNDEA
jgi:DNA-binding MarR family transcriptional regulator